MNEPHGKKRKKKEKPQLEEKTLDYPSRLIEAAEVISSSRNNL